MTTNDAGDNAGDSMEIAADFFERQMDTASGRTTGHREENDDVESADGDELEADKEDETEDDDDAAEHGDDDDEDEDSESDDDEAELLSEKELDRKVPVKNADGKTEYKTVRELMADGMRQSDYTRKTQQIAEDRRQLETRAAELESVRQERVYYQQVLEEHQRKLVADYQPLTDDQWKYLRENDPLEYSIRRQDLQDRKEAFAQAEQQKQYLAQKAAHEQQQSFQATVSNEFTKLHDVHPEWKDPKVWTRVKADILSYGESIGYSKAELQAATDSRAILALHQAMVAAKVRNAKPARASEAKAAPKPMPASSANARSPRAKTELAKAQQRLAKSGSLSDAADMFSRLGIV